MAKGRGKAYPKTYIAQPNETDVSGQISVPIIAMRKWPRIDVGNPTAFEARITEFFDYCIQYNLRPTVELLICSLGVSRQTFQGWERKSGWRSEMIAEAKASINGIMSEMAMNNLINPTTVIWFQKNHEGYQDSVDMRTAPTTGLDSLPSKEEILKRLPVDDTDEKIEEGEYREVDGAESETEG